MDWKDQRQVSEYVELLNEKLGLEPYTIYMMPKSVQDGGRAGDITGDYEWSIDDIVVPSGVDLPAVNDSEITNRITDKMWAEVENMGRIKIRRSRHPAVFPGHNLLRRHARRYTRGHQNHRLQRPDGYTRPD